MHTVNGVELLHGWEAYYVIIGSASGALIGLQFVVMALVADLRAKTSHQTISAFGTPNVVHFSGALLLSAIMSAPWPTMIGISIALVLFSFCGFIYALRVTHRARRQDDYKPVTEDWVWFVIAPFLLYVVLIVAAFMLATRPEETLFVIGGVTASLALIGIRNSWDTVLYLVVRENNNEPDAA